MRADHAYQARYFPALAALRGKLKAASKSRGIRRHRFEGTEIKARRTLSPECKERSMIQQVLPSARSHRSVSGHVAATPVILAATTRGVRLTQRTIEAVGGLIWAALAYRRAFDRAAARVEGDLFDAPVLRADTSTKAWDQAWRASEQAGGARLLMGAGALAIVLALCTAVVRILI
jgi:hypothetical protein